MRFTAKKIKVTHNPYAIYREKMKVTHNPYAIYREKNLRSRIIRMRFTAKKT